MPYSHFGGVNDFMFTVVPVLMIIGFVFVVGFIIASSISGAARWKRNNDSPVLTVDAKVVTKRTNVHHNNNAATDNINDFSSSTTYYATFEVTSGDRLEFEISGNEYGMLVEGDTGKLTFQGTRYLGFERIKS